MQFISKVGVVALLSVMLADGAIAEEYTIREPVDLSMDSHDSSAVDGSESNDNASTPSENANEEGAEDSSNVDEMGEDEPSSDETTEEDDVAEYGTWSGRLKNNSDTQSVFDLYYQSWVFNNGNTFARLRSEGDGYYILLSYDGPTWDDWLGYLDVMANDIASYGYPKGHKKKGECLVSEGQRIFLEQYINNEAGYAKNRLFFQNCIPNSSD